MDDVFVNESNCNLISIDETQSTPSRSSPNTVHTWADSGASSILIAHQDAHNIPHARAPGGHQVQVATGDVITSVASATITPSPGLHIPVHIFPPQTLTQSLCGLAPLTRQGCSVVFTDTTVSVVKDGKVLMEGSKKPQDTLWPLPLSFAPPAVTEQPDDQALLTITHQSNAEYVKFSHATFGSPPVSTFIRAITKGYLGSWPRLTARMVRQNTPNPVATHIGHLDRNRQGQRSTHPQPTHPLPTMPFDSSELDTDVSSPPPDDWTQAVFTQLVNLCDRNHSDSTGRFPVVSSQGNQYILVSVFNNYVHVEPMASRSADSYVKAYKATFAFFRHLKHHIAVQRLDNETSSQLEDFFRTENVAVEYAPAQNHRTVRAERAIRDAKNHIISTLATAHPSFPLELWDRLLPQVELTLNHLRPFGPNPDISAYLGVFRTPYDFLAHPIAPCGTLVLIWESPSTRASWAPHGVRGFYLGPAMDHYRCWRTWTIATRRERISDTLAWFPEHFVMPGASTIDHVSALIADLGATLKNMATSDIVLPNHRDAFQQHTLAATTALDALTGLFHCPPIAVVPAVSAAAPSHTPSIASSPASVQRVVLPTAESPAIQRVDLPNADGPAIQRVVPQGTPEEHVVPVPVAVPAPPPAPLEPEPDASPDDDFVLVPPSPSPSLNDVPNTRVRSSRGRTQPRTCSLQSLPSAALFTPTFTDVQSDDQPYIPSPIDVTTLNLDVRGNPLKWSTALKSEDRDAWVAADAAEFIRLIETTQTMRPIHPQDQPAERRKDTTYYNRVVKVKVKNGVKDFRVRGTVGGDRIHYDGDVAAHTAEMSTVKILLQSVVSDNANFMTVDIKDFYLNTPLTRPEYIKIQVSSIPQAILDRFSLLQYAHNGVVLFEITKGMYGLPQAGLLAQQRLVEHLSSRGFLSGPNTPCLFRHVTRNIAFTLVVDDFGVKYTDKADAEYLIATLKELYELTINWSGDKYLGFTIKHDKSMRQLSISMPSYIGTALKRFGHLITHGAASPAVYTPPHYGSTKPQPATVDDSEPLSPADAKVLQEIVGVFLYYARAVDVSMLPAVTAVASEQAKPTQAVFAAAKRLLSYAASYPANEIVFSACDMVLYGQSDASYLSRSNARSVAGGIFYLGNRNAPTQVNGAIDTFSSIIPVVVASAAEAEYGGLFLAAQRGAHLRNTLADLGYPQDSTLLLCDNECAVGISNDSVKAKRSKSIDMRFHWVRDRVRQGQFVIQWRRGAHNLADFFTKPLPVKVHQSLLPLLVRVPPLLNNPYLTPRHRRAVLHQLHPRRSA